ncbi:MAG: Uma2 family endonuclease [bacterium]|nr:Uma2 family endonuclease [bacterium]
MSTALHLTTDEYDQMVQRGAFDHLNRKIELIRGELREMNPAGPLHDDLVTFLTNWSARSTSAETTMVTSQTGLNLAELESRPEPDLMWLRARRYRGRHPSASDVLLAIEVSSSSLRSDLNEKAGLYAEAGIDEYWIVDAQDQCVHVFRKPEQRQYSQYSVVKVGETLSPMQAPGVLLDLHQLFLGE